MVLDIAAQNAFDSTCVRAVVKRKVIPILSTKRRSIPNKSWINSLNALALVKLYNLHSSFTHIGSLLAIETLLLSLPLQPRLPRLNITLSTQVWLHYLLIDGLRSKKLENEYTTLVMDFDN